MSLRWPRTDVEKTTIPLRRTAVVDATRKPAAPERCATRSRGLRGPSGDMIDYMEHERERLDEAVEEMEFDAKKMQEHSEELADRAEKVKSDWRAKQADEAVPGAQPSRDTNE